MNCAASPVMDSRMPYGSWSGKLSAHRVRGESIWQNDRTAMVSAQASSQRMNQPGHVLLHLYLVEAQRLGLIGLLANRWQMASDHAGACRVVVLDKFGHELIQTPLAGVNPLFLKNPADCLAADGFDSQFPQLANDPRVAGARRFLMLRADWGVSL